MQPYRDSDLGRVVPRLLYTLGTILTFLLLNIQIADYFSVGPTLTFSFTGNFARDMTYSIAWALFAFALLIIGMKKKTKAVRYAGLALLLVTLVKLFLHDLQNLGQLYRIGAFIGVAVDPHRRVVCLSALPQAGREPGCVIQRRSNSGMLRACCSNSVPR